MDFVRTALLLAVCLLGLAILRLRWRFLSRSSHRRWLALFFVLAAISALNRLTKWETTNETIDSALAWIPKLLYSAVVIFFTRLRPRWLTLLIAVVMLLPVFSTSALGPMNSLLHSSQTTTQFAVDGYELEVSPWGTPGNNSGVDYTLVYRRPGLPGLRKGLYSGRLYNSQCRTSAASLAVDAAHNELRLLCPALEPGTGAGPAWGTALVFALR